MHETHVQDAYYDGNLGLCQQHFSLTDGPVLAFVLVLNPNLCIMKGALLSPGAPGQENTKAIPCVAVLHAPPYLHYMYVRIGCRFHSTLKLL